MAFRPIALCLAGSLLAAQAPSGLAPALYTLRATDKTGASLILLDEKGQETVVDKDDRTAGGGGFMSTVLYHATFFGAFTATPDLKTVLFTRHGKVKAPFTFSLGGFSGGSGGGLGYAAAFGEHDLEGIFAWDRATAKATRIWDQDTLLAQLKAWVKTPEGAAYAKVDLKDELRAHRPSSLFHLRDTRFVWINGATAFDLDLATRTARILFSDLGDGLAVGALAGHVPTAAGGVVRESVAGVPGMHSGTGVSLAFTQKPALTQATQNADGSLTLLRPGLIATITREGAVQILGLGHGHRLVGLGRPTLIAAHAEGLRFLEAKAPRPQEAPMAKVENSLIQASADSRHAFLYQHYKIKEDTLSKVDAKDGKVLWTARLGDCRFGFLMAEAGDHLHVLVRRSSGNTPMRLTLASGTGALVTQEPWLPGEALEKTLGGYPAPVDLADQAALIPCDGGFLVWAPSRGKATSTPAGGWTTEAPALAQLGAELALDGQWCLLTPQLALKPIARRPLADQMVVLAGSHMEPVGTWLNQGIMQSSNPGDRPVGSMSKDPLPFFPRDFGFSTPLSLEAFAQRMVAPPVAPAP